MDKIKDIVLLGATGSIGTQTLEICSNKKIKVKGIAFNNSYEKAIEIIEKYDPICICTSSLSSFEKLKEIYKDKEIVYGDEGFKKIVDYSDNIVNAITGIAGLKPTIYSLKRGKTIYLANKETLVVAGDLIKREAQEKNVKIIPIDSEHDAIYRLIHNNKLINCENKDYKISRLIITASGGAFKNKTREELKDVTIEEALKHPNWSRGKKITIDSQTMVNKALEIIEAYYLFDIDYDKIETIIHPESIIHSMVEYCDGSVEAVMYNPTMLIPIQNALLKDFENINVKKLDFNSLKSLTFMKMDFDRFPVIRLAYEVLKKKGFYPVCFNASNEACVDLFLKGKISFLDIEKIILETIKIIETLKVKDKKITELEYNFENILLVHETVIKKIKEVYE